MCASTAPLSEPAPYARRSGEPDTRPGLVIISNSVTPYLVNLHQLVAAGIPELKLLSPITHGIADFDWQVSLPPEINAQNFSSATGEHPQDNPLRRPLVEIRKGRQLTRYLEQHNARAIIINGYRYISYLWLMNYCYRRNIPFFVRNDSNIRNEPALSLIKRTIKRGLYHWWMRRAAGVFSMGSLGDAFFVKYGADPSRLYRAPYWPDFSAFATCDASGLERFRQTFGLRPNRRYLMFSGRLVSVKRVDLVVDAFVAIAADRPNWDLLIAGDGVLRPALQRRVPEVLKSRVVWTGFLDGVNMRLAYHAADVLVLPSDREPWAVVVQEAMAAGLVVVASDVVGAAHELVEDGQSGRIFPIGNLRALEAALLDVTANEKFAQYKRHSHEAVKQYQIDVDPIQEIRRALTDVGVLEKPAPIIGQCSEKKVVIKDS